MLLNELTISAPGSTVDPEDLLVVIGKPVQLTVFGDETDAEDTAVFYGVIDAVFPPQGGADGAIRLRSLEGTVEFGSDDTLVVRW